MYPRAFTRLLSRLVPYLRGSAMNAPSRVLMWTGAKYLRPFLGERSSLSVAWMVGGRASGLRPESMFSIGTARV